MTELNHFYSKLYRKGRESSVLELERIFLDDPNFPKLNETQKCSCEGKLSVNEFFNALSAMKNGSTPGNDGLTVEFYKCFWPVVGKQLVECLNYSFDQGQLSNSQRQAIIILKEKKES